MACEKDVCICKCESDEERMLFAKNNKPDVVMRSDGRFVNKLGGDQILASYVTKKEAEDAYKFFTQTWNGQL